MSSKTKKNKYEIDMCSGSIMDKLIAFSLPLMLSGILQLMFNAVDIVVVGKFSGSEALAAVAPHLLLLMCLPIYLSGYRWEPMYWLPASMPQEEKRRCPKPYIHLLPLRLSVVL